MIRRVISPLHRGITLIALIITIIVLLILAGTAIKILNSKIKGSLSNGSDMYPCK